MDAPSRTNDHNPQFGTVRNLLFEAKRPTETPHWMGSSIFRGGYWPSVAQHCGMACYDENPSGGTKSVLQQRRTQVCCVDPFSGEREWKLSINYRVGLREQTWRSIIRYFAQDRVQAVFCEVWH